MAKPINCTVVINPDDLKDCIQLKINSLRRAINAEAHPQIREVRQAVIKDLELAIMSINQGELPGIAKK